jgi:hypothetical protein
MEKIGIKKICNTCMFFREKKCIFPMGFCDHQREGETAPRINLEKTDTFKKINKRLNVKEIIENYLKTNGYDGLSFIWNNEVDCTCEINKLFWCGEIGRSCRAWKEGDNCIAEDMENK